MSLDIYKNKSQIQLIDFHDRQFVYFNSCPWANIVCHELSRTLHLTTKRFKTVFLYITESFPVDIFTLQNIISVMG